MRKPQPPKKPTEGPIPTIPNGFKWKGEKYPKDRAGGAEGFIFVEPEDMPEEFPRFSPNIVPRTRWVVEPRKNQVIRIATDLPFSALHGWSTCGRCNNLASRCICQAGIMHPRAIEFIYIHYSLQQDGVDIGHPVNVADLRFVERGLHWYRKRDAKITPATYGAPLKPRPAPTPARKATLTRKDRGGASMAVTDDMDTGAIDAAAARSAKALTRTMKRTLQDAKPKKTLKRRKRSNAWDGT